MITIGIIGLFLLLCILIEIGKVVSRLDSIHSSFHNIAIPPNDYSTQLDNIATEIDEINNHLIFKSSESIFDEVVSKLEDIKVELADIN